MWNEDTSGHAGNEQVMEFEEFNARFATMADNAAGTNVNIEIKSENDNSGNQTRDSMACEPRFPTATSYIPPMRSQNFSRNSGLSASVNVFKETEGVPLNSTHYVNGNNNMHPEKCSWSSAEVNKYATNPISKPVSATSRTQLKQQLMRQQTLQQEEIRARRQQQKYQQQKYQQQLLLHQQQQKQYLHQTKLTPAKNYQCSNATPIQNDITSPTINDDQVKSGLENPTNFHMVESCRRNIVKRPPEGSPSFMGPTEGASAPPGWLYSIPESKIIPKQIQPWGTSEPGYLFNTGQLLGQETRIPNDAPSAGGSNILLRGYTSNRSLSQGTRDRPPRQTPKTSCAGSSGGNHSLSASSAVSSAAPSVDNSEVDEVLLQELVNYERDYSNENSNPSTNSITKRESHVPDSFCELFSFDGNFSSSRPTDVNSPEVPQIKNEPLSSTEQPYPRESFVKERKKKDTHNKIERSRRSHINDMIQELKSLLPQNGEQFFEKIFNKRQYKGHILTATVEYIKLMRYDLDTLSEADRRRSVLEIQNRQMQQRIQKLESCLKENNIVFDKAKVEPDMPPEIIRSDIISSTTPTNTSETSASFAHQLDLQATDDNLPSQEMPLVHADSTDFFNNYTDFDLMEDEPVSYCNNVMLSSPPMPSPNSVRHYSVEDSLPLQPMDIAS